MQLTKNIHIKIKIIGGRTIVHLFLLMIVIILSLLLFKEKYKKNSKSVIIDDNEEDYTMPLSDDELLTEPLDNNRDCSLKGEVLNDLYLVEGLLGEGGMGKVYLCRNIKLGNLWAVKVLHKRDGKNKALSTAEEDILKKLNHIHLPRIVDVFEDKEGTYIVESYIEGVSLDKKLKAEESFEEKQVVKWSKQLADVLNYLHGMKPHPIIYGDMKPSNVMITPDDKAVLIDFGVSMEFKGEVNKQASKSTVAVTAKFAAPEQFNCYADVRTDIYGLGIMMFYLLSGKLPIEGMSVKQQLTHISKGLIEILEKCLHKEMDKRYQTMEELIKVLNSLESKRKGLFSSFKTNETYNAPLDYKKIIVIMGPESTGKTAIAVNLAWILSEKRIKTTLIDADFENKDIYYYFNKDFSNCLSNAEPDTGLKAQNINQYLTFYSEHRDVDVALSIEQLKNLILQCKTEAQVVIVDLGSYTTGEEINHILSLADHKILVVDQRVNLLNRLPKKLYLNSRRLEGVDLIINRYKEEGFINERNIIGFFKDIEIKKDIHFNMKINKVYKVKEDYTAILKGLEERVPPVAIGGNKIKEDMVKLSQQYYRDN